MKKQVIKIFNDLNKLRNNHTIPNDMRANQARKIFEWALKEKLNIQEEEHISLNILFDEYVDKYKPEGIRYGGKELIKKLNKFSHHTDKNLTDKELENMLEKLNFILESIFSMKNNSYKMNRAAEKLDALDGLNDEQKAAVLSGSRLTLINAGPGTGKTHLIIHRILASVQQYPENKIIALSFTNQAANELKSKLEYYLFGMEGIDRNRFFTGTIHSFAFDTVRSYYKEVLKKEYDYEIIDEEEFKNIQQEFHSNKSAIQNFLEEHHLLTFDMILMDFKKMLKEENGFKSFVTRNIQEVIIDEAQDLDKKQYDIFLEIFKDSKTLRLFLVGDQRQNIFDFNGGSLNNLQKTFAEVEIKTYDLKISYRCPNRVLELVNSFRFEDTKNVPLKNIGLKGDDILLDECRDKTSEAKKITQYIRGKVREGYTLDKIAILSPSSYYFGEIAKTLNEENIPFKLFGGQSLMKPEIRYVLNIMKTIATQKKYYLEKLISYWDLELNSDKRILQKNINDLLSVEKSKDPISNELADTLKFIRDHVSSRPQRPDIILQDFIEFNKTQEIFHTEVENLFNDLLKWIQNNQIETIEKVGLYLTPSSEDKEVSGFFNRSLNIRYKEKVPAEFVTLSTIHSAKGKEWEVVIIPGMTQDIFPSYKALINGTANSELKKFYVACTRTLDHLYFLRPRSYTVRTKKGTDYLFTGKPISVFLQKNIPNFVETGSC